MAATATGARLTQAHRQAQLAVRAAVMRDLLTLWRLFDPSEPESYEEFTRLAGILIGARYSDSAGMAAAYYREFLRVEGIDTRVTPTIPPALDPERIRTSLYATGFAGTRRALRAGMSVPSALSQGFVMASGSAARLALEGGREAVLQTAESDGRVSGWIRVPSGNACAFCAMLASRGPVYKQESADFESHDHCSCVAEPYYDGSAWPKVNQQYRDRWYETTGGKGGNDALNAFRAALEGRAE